MVSTNHVYRLSLADGGHLVAKVSSYGSYWLFKEDHDRLHQCRAAGRLPGTPTCWPTRCWSTGGSSCIEGAVWAALYGKCRSVGRCAHRVVRRRPEPGRGDGQFHQACREVARLVPPTSTSIKSGAIHAGPAVRSATLRSFPTTTRINAQEHCGVPLATRHARPRRGSRFPSSSTGTWATSRSTTTATASASTAAGTTTGSGWTRGRSTSTSCRGSPAAPATGPCSAMARTFVEPRFQLFLNAYHRVYPLRWNEVVPARGLPLLHPELRDPPGLRLLPA